MAAKLTQLADFTIDTAGSRETLSATSVRVISVIIAANKSNVGKVYVGDSAVASGVGQELSPGEALSIDAGSRFNHSETLDLADIYVDTETNGNKVKVSYILARR